MNNKRRSGDLTVKNSHMALVMSIASSILLLVTDNWLFALYFIIFMSTTYVCRSIEVNTEIIKKEIKRGTNVTK
jgi:hypothetical protein